MNDMRLKPDVYLSEQKGLMPESEPRRWTDSEGSDGTLYEGRLSIIAKPSMTASDGTVAVGIDFPFEVVESGHDEQTEDEHTIERYARELARVEVQAKDNNRRAEQLEAALATERERTVAAVVEALREGSGSEDRTIYVRDALDDAADFIEERFKPSAPGGADGH